jgi:glycosyltransferase involved in cell wall biosynthesis
VKILMVTSLYAPHIGGVEVHVERLSEALQDRGHEVDIVTSTTTGEQGRTGNVFHFRSLGPQNEYHFAPGIAAFAFKNASRYDVVHCHNYHALPAALTMISARGASLVFTPHYCGPDHNAKPVQYAIYSRLMRRVLGRTRRIICVGEEERKAFCKLFPFIASRSEVIPNGVRDEQFEPREPRARSESELLVVSRLERFKRVDRTIRALAYLPDWQLTVLGEGPARPELEQLASDLGVSDRVQWRGGRPYDEVLEAYAAATVFISQSAAEGFGMTLIEAAASGCPVVASAIPPHAELSRACEGVFLSDVDIEPEGLAALIQSAAGTISRLKDPEAYRWANIAAATELVYEEALQADAPAPTAPK